MGKDQIPPIMDKHRAFALRFRRALAWAELLSYDEQTGARKGSYRKAADKLKVSGGYLGELYRGEKFPSGVQGIEIADRLGVSPSWLTGGKGAMVADRMISIDHLSETDQAVVLSVIKSLEDKTQ